MAGTSVRGLRGRTLRGWARRSGCGGWSRAAGIPRRTSHRRRSCSAAAILRSCRSASVEILKSGHGRFLAGEKREETIIMECSSYVAMV